jgi:hypothetical protein
LRIRHRTSPVDFIAASPGVSFGNDLHRRALDHRRRAAR